jgi:hypothetical protein
MNKINENTYHILRDPIHWWHLRPIIGIQELKEYE